LSSSTQQYPTNPYSAQATLGPPNGPPGKPVRSGGGGWKWLFIIFGIGGLGLVACCGICGGIAYFGANMIKYAPPYQQSLAKVRESVEVKDKIGNPIEDTPILEGTKSNFNNGNQEMQFSYKAKGPNGEATVFVDASGRGNDWTLHKCTVTFADGTTLDLSDPPTAEGDTPAEGEAEPAAKDAEDEMKEDAPAEEAAPAPSP
jgi:hypothetical protein